MLAGTAVLVTSLVWRLAINHRNLTNGSSFTYEVIVVDDGSTDGTAAEVYRWVERLGTDVVRLLTLRENQGKGAAVGKV